MLRRNFIKGFGALAATGMASCTPNPRRDAALWSPAVKALDELLGNHSNKHVIGYWDHTRIEAMEFFARRDFWDMLHANGFTDHFMELADSDQADVDKAARDPRSVNFPIRANVDEVYFARQSGIKSTCIDRGVRETSPLFEGHTYLKWAFKLWEERKVAAGLKYTDNEVEKQTYDMAAYIRGLKQQKEFAWLNPLAEKTIMHLNNRLNDSKTGLLSSHLSRRAAGQVWQLQGRAHFSPCGLHTSLNNPLVLNIFCNEYQMREAEAEHRNADVFIDRAFNVHTEPFYSFLIKEAKIFRAEPLIDAARAKELKRTCEALTGAQRADTGWESAVLDPNAPTIRRVPVTPMTLK